MNKQLFIKSVFLFLAVSRLVLGQSKEVPGGMIGTKTTIPKFLRQLNLKKTVGSIDPNKPLPNQPVPFKTATFQTNGKQIMDPCGSPVILKGVNKMAVFDHNDPFGRTYFPEIAKSGANCVRIAWEMTSTVNHKVVVNLLARLDQLITNARQNKLIPIVGLWDFTQTTDGGFSKLSTYAAYWTRPDIVALIRKHQAYLIVNFANEAATGDENDSTNVADYARAYKKVVLQLRRSGINVPVMIDGMDEGKSLRCFARKGPEMLDADPKHNLIFAFHAYWPKSATDTDESFIASAFAEVSPLPIALVISELAGFGAWAGSAAVNICSPAGQVDYQQFVRLAETAGMGWLIWEWGPGNQWQAPGDCPQLNMTTDGTYQSIETSKVTDPNGWVRNLTIDGTFSIKNSARKTFFIKSGFTNCPNP